MGADGPGAGFEGGVRALTAATRGALPSAAEGQAEATEADGRRVPGTAEKVPAERLYGRIRGHTLRPRQQRLLDEALPRLRAPGTGAELEDPWAMFGVRPARLGVEVGFGGGEHAVALAAADPGLGLIACEVFVTGICSLLSKLVPEPADPVAVALPGNLRVYDEDARPLLRGLPAGCLDLVALMFPDPWPKVRHAKRRFVHPAQVALVGRVLRPGGTWRVASDDPVYQAWVQEVMAAQTLFACTLDQPERPAGWPPTRYEAKALRAGRQPRYWCFVRAAGLADAGVSGCGWSGQG